jgi:cytochrome c
MLINNSDGINLLMKSIKEGSAPARLLKERAIEESLLSKIEPNKRKEYVEFTANILRISEEQEKLANERLADFDPKGKTVAMGKMVFSQNCIMCHQIDNKGSLIGP